MSLYPPSDRRGAVTLSAFAFIWALVTGSSLPWAALGWTVIAVAAVTALLVGRAALRTAPEGDDPPPEAMRRLGAVNLAQAAAIAAVVAVFIATGIERFIPAAVCLIVAVHFVPLVPVFGQPLYRRLAGELGLVALLGFVVALLWPTAALPVVGLGAAVVLLGMASRLIDSARRSARVTSG